MSFGAVRLGLVAFTLAAAPASIWAQAPAAPPAAPYTIDLGTALRLAGAKDLDVQIARERSSEARGAATSAAWQFLPWLSPQGGYRRHGDLIQDVVGNIVTADKQSYAVGLAANLQVDVGDALFRTLAARQAVRASDQQLETQRQDALLRAAQAYFDLLEAQATTAAAREALQISRDYESQLQRAVDAGIALRSEELRVRVQSQRYQLTLQQAQETQRVEAARLAETLRLDPAVDLVGNDAELAPVTVAPVTETPAALVQQALAARSELREGQALVQLASENEKATVVGPLVPSVTAQAFVGGLGGGKLDGPSSFGAARDYVAAVSWRIGPGGLFDLGRIRASRARLAETQLRLEKLRDVIARQVVEAHTRALSQDGQLKTAREALQTAEDTLELTRQRRDLEVGAVLENILSEQDQARARQDYARALGEYNTGQYALLRALGRLGASGTSPSAVLGPAPDSVHP